MLLNFNSGKILFFKFKIDGPSITINILIETWNIVIGLKVSESQKQFFLVSNLTKSKRNFLKDFCPSIYNGSNQNNKGTLLY